MSGDLWVLARNGTTLLPARSLAIHCTRKRAVKNNCAIRPKASQKSNLATKTSYR